MTPLRVANRVLAVAAALAVAAGGLLVAVEIALAGLGQEPWLIPYEDWYTSARNNGWDSPGARSLFLGLTVAGVVVLGLQTVKPRPRSVPLEDGLTRAGLSRRSLERTLARAAGGEEGVETATARVRRRRAQVVAATRLPPEALRPRLEEAAHNRLRNLGLDGRLDVAVRVRSQKQAGGMSQ